MPRTVLQGLQEAAGTLSGVNQQKRQQSQQELVNQIALQKLAAQQAGTQRELQAEEARQLRAAPFISGEKTLPQGLILDPIAEESVKAPAAATNISFGDQSDFLTGRTLGTEQPSQSPRQINEPQPSANEGQIFEEFDDVTGEVLSTFRVVNGQRVEV